MKNTGLASPNTQRDGVIVDTRVLPETKDLLHLLRQLAEDGLLDPGFAASETNTVSEKVRSGNTGIWSPSLWNFRDVVAFSEQNPSAIFELVGPVSNVNGQLLGATCRPDVTFDAIAVDSLHPNAAIALLKEYHKSYNAVHSRAAQCDDILTFAPANAVYNEVQPALTELTNRRFNQIILGSGSVDDEFEEYVQEWKRRGGDSALVALNEWWSNRDRDEPPRLR